MFVRSLAKYWAPVVAWVLLIFLASGDLMSAEHTSRFLVPFLRWLSPQISENTIGLIQFIMRKSAHLTEYAVLAAVTWRALRFQFPSAPSRVQAMVAFFAGITCATLDEFHQSFVPARTSSPFDVAIDGAGTIIGLVLYWFMTRVGKRKFKN